MGIPIHPDSRIRSTPKATEGTKKGLKVQIAPIGYDMSPRLNGRVTREVNPGKTQLTALKYFRLSFSDIKHQKTQS